VGSFVFIFVQYFKIYRSIFFFIIWDVPLFSPNLIIIYKSQLLLFALGGWLEEKKK